MQQATDQVSVEVLQAEDQSHVLIAYPWYAEPADINAALEQAKMLGYTEMTSEGNLVGHESQGCSDWDYIRVEPADA